MKCPSHLKAFRIQRRLAIAVLIVASACALAPAQFIDVYPRGSLGNGALPAYMTVLDVNHDGIQDVVVSYATRIGYPGGLYWYQGSSARKIWSYPDQQFFSDMAVGDFDKDNVNELIGLYQPNLYMIKNVVGQSTKTLNKVDTLTWITDCNISTGDLNEDGNLDIVGTFRARDDYDPNKLFWYKNNGEADPTFSKQQIPSSIAEPKHIFLGDMDRDGGLDIVLSGYNGTASYFNDGASTPTLSEDYLTTDTFMEDVQDFDGDGDLDLLCSTKSKTVVWLENNGARPPKFIPHPLVDKALSDMAFCDLNQDGKLDIAGAYFDKTNGKSYLAYYENHGGWPPKYQYYVLEEVGYMLQLRVAPIYDKHRYQFIASYWNNNISNQLGWVRIYDTTIIKNSVRNGPWSIYQ